MISVLLLVSLLGFAPQAAPSPAPSAAPVDLNLPEIGRVRSVTPACSVMRDLTIPAFTAARRSDARFDKQIVPKLPEYARVLSDKYDRVSVLRDMMISRMSQQVSLMLADAQTIAKALGDPRISKDSNDPQVQAQRAQLEQLYEYQMGRATILLEYTHREAVAATLEQLSPNGESSPSPTPAPGVSRAPDDMPQLYGIDVQDADVMRGWATDINRGVRSSEEEAAKTFLPILHGCQ